MPLHHPLNIPERIFVFGPPGSSKSTMWLNIAKFAALTKSDAQFYILDTDFAVDRMLTSYPETVDRIHVSTGYEWRDYMQFLIDIRTKARPQDWVIVDFIASAWQAVQDDFVMQVFAQDTADYFLKVRKEAKKDSASLEAFSGWVDWQVINQRYFQWAKPLIFGGRYNLYATSKADALSSGNKPTESAAVRSLFLPYGVKPQGQKDLPFSFHTVLITGKSPTGWTLTSVKDRERELLTGLEVSNFTTDYLVKVAGWKLA